MPARVGKCVVVGETRDAIKVRLDGEHRERWIPKSVLADESEAFDARDNASGELVLRTWFAVKEGLA